MITFNDNYKSIIARIISIGNEDTNIRTNVKVKALPGITVQVDLEKEFPLISLRKISAKNAIAEVMWFISGEKDTNVFLNSHTKIWNSFTDKNGEVDCAYGYRWRHHFFRDQLSELIRLLEKDPSSRHGVVITWDASNDGLLGPPKKNVPCPYTFTVNIIGGKLHLHNIIRSNDMILGFPTDVATFSLLALILAQKLGVKPGIYTHSISNAHIYENHYDAALEMTLLESMTMLPITIPNNSFVRAVGLKEDLFDEFLDEFDKYKSHPSIKGLTITL